MKYLAAVGISVLLIPPLLLALAMYELHQYWRDTEKYMWE